MFKKNLLIAWFIVSVSAAVAQESKTDSIAIAGKDSMSLSVDPDLDYDALLDEFDLFLDSLLRPRSYVLLNLSGSQEYFNFINKATRRVSEIRKWIWSPALGYYDKSGLGITFTGYMIHDTARRYFYQGSVSPSYDYLKDRKMAAGISYTKYFTKNSLPFYTSPLQNEFNGYFLWRKSWMQPGIAANYGWGNRTEFNKREIIYKTLLAAAANKGTIRYIDTVSILTKNKESIVDFSLVFSLRHDFYWLDVFSKKDHIRLSPLVSLSAGTQRFGFNQSNTAFGNLRAVALNNTRSVNLRQKFQLLSMTFYLRSEYSVGKFFIQPQILFDYYLPGETKKFTSLFSVNTGFMF